MMLPGPEAGCPAGRKTFALVDLGAVDRNVRAIRDQVGPEVGIAAIVKADAYGHGIVETGRAALAAGASMLGIAMAEEAEPLRAAGVSAPILVIGPSNGDQLELGTRLDLDLCVFTPEHLRQLEATAERQGKTVRVHLKADTGMGRIGFTTTQELERLLEILGNSPHLALAGIFTHFASADHYADQSASRAQHARFMKWADLVRSRGFSPKLHVSNSAAAQDLPEFDHDMIRFGISLYGYAPAADAAARSLSLSPAMEVWAEISHIKDLRPGDAVGYGSTFRAARPMRVATVQIGYGDGYNRLLSNRGCMIVPAGRGAVCAPIVGRVCMDMTMIDVTDAPELRPGDLALAMGRLDGLHMDADDIAALCDTISYEVLLDYTKRLPRIYTGAPEPPVSAEGYDKRIRAVVSR